MLIADVGMNHAPSFKSIVDFMRPIAPQVRCSVIQSKAQRLMASVVSLARPTLVVSFVPLARFRPLRGTFLHGINFSKSEEYSRLESAGFSVPQWQLLRPDEKPDLSDYGPYVVTKPDRGMRGALVKIKKAGRVRYEAKDKADGKNQPASKYGAKVSGQKAMLAQQFIYTGQWPISYRVTTLFGKVIHSVKIEADRSRKALTGPESFDTDGISGIVATGKGCAETLNYDEEIIRLGEAAHAAFPEIPLLGFDIVREVPSGKLFILEANAVGYVWLFSSPMGLSIQRDNNFNYESQFDGLRKAAHILADKAQELAR
jgi:hypothetical protein